MKEASQAAMGVRLGMVKGVLIKRFNLIILIQMRKMMLVVLRSERVSSACYSAALLKSSAMQDISTGGSF